MTEKPKPVDYSVKNQIEKLIRISPLFNYLYDNNIDINKYIEKYFTSEGWESLYIYIYPHNARVKPSKSALIISNKVKKQLGIELLPIVIPIARKGFDIEGGTYSFMMVDKKGVEWCFFDRACRFQRKNIKIEIWNDDILANMDNAIIINHDYTKTSDEK